jgi:hypothetical protein
LNGTPASPWLRCLGALLQAKKESLPSAKHIPTNATLTSTTPYIQSLPASDEYETLFQWSLHEIQKYLGGTTLGKVLLLDRNEKSLEKRYQLGVVPFLQHLGVLDKKRQRRGDTTAPTDELAKTKEFSSFLEASMCISTRGFHLMDTGEEKEDEKKVDAAQPAYDGPFLLPVIDLLNHDPAKACTTLQRDAATGNFSMVAERPLVAGEDVMHSYGDSLTSAQLLQTFGFVPRSHTEKVLKSSGSVTTTPTSLHKIDHVIRASLIMKSSSFPKELQENILGTYRKKIKRQDNADATALHIDDDKVWQVEDIPDRRMADSISEEFLLSVADSGRLLRDDLITLCVVQFLPEEAFDDVFSDERSSTRLDRSILEDDNYLGMLVCHTILTAISIKADEYAAPLVIGSTSSGKKRPASGVIGFPTSKAVEVSTNKIESTINDDRKILSHMMTKAAWSQQEERETYGRTIRVEELSNLLALTLEIQQLVDILDHSIQPT